MFEAEEDRVLDEGGESGESAAEARREWSRIARKAMRVVNIVRELIAERRGIRLSGKIKLWIAVAGK